MRKDEFKLNISKGILGTKDYNLTINKEEFKTLLDARIRVNSILKGKDYPFLEDKYEYKIRGASSRDGSMVNPSIEGINPIRVWNKDKTKKIRNLSNHITEKIAALDLKIIKLNEIEPKVPIE